MDNENQYSGAALSSFLVGLAGAENIVRKLLADAGVDEIDPEGWYPHSFALSIYFKIEEALGRATLMEVGRKMIEVADYPPEINSVETLLPALGQWYALHARGPDVGEISYEFEDEHSAILDWSAKGPCSLCVGIIEGACGRYGVSPLIEHGPEGCKDTGHETCIYYVSW